MYIITIKSLIYMFYSEAVYIVAVVPTVVFQALQQMRLTCYYLFFGLSMKTVILVDFITG